MKQRIITLVGPTASGKSDLASQLARKVNGSIISADSVQVYKGLDIISGKDRDPKAPFYPLNSSMSASFTFGYYLQNNSYYYLYDIVEPQIEFSVASFCILAKEAIKHSHQHDRLPFIVGGSIFYVNTLLDGNETLSIPPNEMLRNELNEKNVDELQDELRIRNSERLLVMNNSDRHNKRRLIRAIEIHDYQKTGVQVEKIEGISSQYEIIEIGIERTREDIKERIDKRIDLRLQNGALAEAQRLYVRYELLNPLIKETTGYKELFEYLEGKIELKQAIQKWREAEYLLAKHQLTFLKKRKNIQWFNPQFSTFQHDLDHILSL